jgi:hypothetical protein
LDINLPKKYSGTIYGQKHDFANASNRSRSKPYPYKVQHFCLFKCNYEDEVSR